MKGGTIIKQARTRAGLSQAALARRAGTTQSAIARWEAGKVSPSVENLDRLVTACGLSLNVLLLESNEHDLGLALSNLRLTPEQRLERFMGGVRFAKELRHAAGTAS